MQGNIRKEIVKVLRNRSTKGGVPEVTSSFDTTFRRCKLISLPLMLLLLAAVLNGCENKQKIQRGVLGGFVLDTSGNRISGAAVTSHRSLFVAETGSDGRYTFTSLDSGSHNLNVVRSGFKTATATIHIDYGSMDLTMDFKLEPLPGMIAWQVFKRESATVTVDVSCAEPMACTAIYSGQNFAMTRTTVSAKAMEHRFILGPLLPDTRYRLHIEGITNDGRRYESEAGFFKPTPTGDIAGIPPAPVSVSLEQTTVGPKLSWKYEGVDPLKGFRIWRGSGDEALELWHDEEMIFASQFSITDEYAVVGTRLRYAIQAVDLDDELSPITPETAMITAGTLSGDTVWKSAWSPIDLKGDIHIPAGRILKIEPGVTIRVNSEDHYQSGYDPNSVEIIAEGRLECAGNEDKPIRFISAAALPGRTDWTGIRIAFAKDSDASLLCNTEITNAATGIQISSPNPESFQFKAFYCETGLKVSGATDASFDNLAFDDCRTAIWVEGSQNTSLSNMKIIKGETGINLRRNKACSIKRCDIRSVRNTGLHSDDSTPSIVKGCIIASKGKGIVIQGAGSDICFVTIDAADGIVVDNAQEPIIRNNIIVNRTAPDTGTGIRESTTGRNYPFNNIFGYLDATYNCDQLGAAILNVDPMFIGGSEADFNYSLTDASPLKTASDVKGEIGAFGWSLSD